MQLDPNFGTPSWILMLLAGHFLAHRPHWVHSFEAWIDKPKIFAPKCSGLHLNAKT